MHSGRGRYYWEWWKHRLTCFRCHPSHLTGMSRNQQGRGPGDAAIVAVLGLLLLAAIGAACGYFIQGG